MGLDFDWELVAHTFSSPVLSRARLNDSFLLLANPLLSFNDGQIRYQDAPRVGSPELICLDAFISGASPGESPRPLRYRLFLSDYYFTSHPFFYPRAASKFPQAIQFASSPL